MWGKVRLLYHTLKFLKPIQINYRLFYWLRGHWRRLSGYRRAVTLPGVPARLPAMVPGPEPATRQYLGEGAFRYLNREKHFGADVDWNFRDYGKLWTYNLNYFEFLLQSDLSEREGLRLIHHFIDRAAGLQDAWEPYPLSLRIIHWIKFAIRHGIRDRRLEESLRAQTEALIDQREYHLLGNHLLENGFALYFAAVYFEDVRYYAHARGILKPQLREQVLADGAHFELSPMYHQLMLWRILDCYNLATRNPGEWTELRELFSELGRRMLSWLNHLTFTDGSIPLLNDAAPGINPSTASLREYAEELGLPHSSIPLGASGYRMRNGERWQVIFDAGVPGPDYIPGHAHCDALSVLLAVDGMPVLVDRGVSTYEATEQRWLERSTTAHNTVSVAGAEQAEIWASFRMGRRSRPVLLVDEPDRLAARIDYPTAAYWHERTLRVMTQDSIRVEDRCNAGGVAYFHFAPGLEPERIASGVRAGDVTFAFSSEDWSLEPYRYATGFNKLVPATRVVIRFDRTLTTDLTLSRSFS